MHLPLSSRFTVSIATAIPVLALLTFACGPGSTTSSGATTNGDGGPLLALTGSAGGVSLTAVDGYARITADTGGGGKTRFSAIFSDKANLCSSGIFHQNGTVLNLDLQSPDATLVPGVFPINDSTHSTPPYSDAPLVKLDGACKASPDRGAKSGSVTIATVSSTAVTGSFDITYPDGNVKGTFNVPLSCPSPAANTCMP